MMRDDRTEARRQKQYGRIARTPGLKNVSRPLRDAGALPLAYTRSGPTTERPVLVLPGGPGLGSVVPYHRLRLAAEKSGLDLLMVEHRGIGMSRRTERGDDIAAEEVVLAEVLADLAAVLDAEGLDQVIVYGSSYGSYLAGAFARLHPHRVAGMILDSAMLDASSQIVATRRLNDLYWHGEAGTSDHARRLRALVEGGTLDASTAGFPVQTLHESGGPEAVASMLDLLERGRGRRTWRWIEKLGSAEVMQSRPFMMEFDLVARIAFTELNYGAPHDAALGPLRSDTAYGELSERYPPFAGEPFDLRAALPTFDWPVLVLSGDRDVRTPRSVAQDVADAAPRAELVPVTDHGHSALDNAQPVAIHAMSRMVDRLGSERPQSGEGVDELVAGPSVMSRLLSMRLRASRLLPRALS